MIAYRIRYQTKNNGCESVPIGDWINKKMVVVVEEDASDAVKAILADMPSNYDFRLKGIEITGRIDKIAIINPKRQESQDTTE